MPRPSPDQIPNYQRWPGLVPPFHREFEHARLAHDSGAEKDPGGQGQSVTRAFGSPQEFLLVTFGEDSEQNSAAEGRNEIAAAEKLNHSKARHCHSDDRKLCPGVGDPLPFGLFVIFFFYSLGSLDF